MCAMLPRRGRSDDRSDPGFLYGIEAHEPERERVQLAILKLSCGDADRLLATVQAANEDYRDVLWWAEYPNPNGPQQGPPEDTEALLGWLEH